MPRSRSTVHRDDRIFERYSAEIAKLKPHEKYNIESLADEFQISVKRLKQILFTRGWWQPEYYAYRSLGQVAYSPKHIILGGLIAHIILNEQISYDQIVEETRLSKKALTMFLEGRREITLTELLQVCTVLGITASELFIEFEEQYERYQSGLQSDSDTAG